MKTRRLERVGIIFLVAVGTLLMPSCKKKSDDPQPEEPVVTPVTPVTNGKFAAKINGVLKTFGNSYYTSNNAGGTAINGSEVGGAGITLAFFSTTTGSNDIDGTFAQAYYYVGSTQHTATSGEIVVTKVESNKMSGTFYFETASGVKVTEGTFTEVLKK